MTEDGKINNFYWFKLNLWYAFPIYFGRSFSYEVFFLK